MSDRKRQQYSPTFKAEAVRFALEGERSIAAVARDLGVRADLIRKWKQEHLAQGLVPAPVRDLPPGAGPPAGAGAGRGAPGAGLFKKSHGVLCARVAVRCACIHRHRGQFPLGLMCRVLAVARSSYYAWRQRGVSGRAQANAALLARIRGLYQGSDATYGSPRMYQDLQAEGRRCGRHRVARLMRTQGLFAVSRRRWRVTTRRDPRREPAPNRLARDFRVTAPNQVWAADITYVPTRAGWLYLALVLDVGTRRVVGWAMARHLKDSLVIEALEMALGRRAIAPGLVHHSDQGRQYTSARYQAVLARHGILPSMSRVGECWDNAVAESFFATLKCERLHRRDYRTPAEAQADIFRYIESWYNPRRRHSALGDLSPIEYEQQWAA